ncbi:MAG: energy transducer TonB [Terriglobales bacterium]|jgi:TonB family protein
MTLFPRPSFFLTLFFLTLSIFSGSVFTTSSLAQSQPESTSKRRLVERSQPVYPSLGRTLRLEGIVRIEAVVSPDGTVKSVAIKGGHPVLADAAASAVRQWKWERAAQESHELVEVKFTRPE